MTVSGQITDEKLAEIIKGCEGVTPGPWQVVVTTHPWSLEEREILGETIPAKTGEHTELRVFTTWEDGQLKAPYPVVNSSVGIGLAAGKPVHMVAMEGPVAAHIARLDPQTVLSLLTELQHRREAEASGVSNALLNAVAHAIEGAYVRGVEWCEENPNGGSYRFKAGSDYADKAFHDPDSELCKALSAAPSSPASNHWGEPGVDLDIWRYERVHEAAIAAYELHVPKDYRYSATALRHAVDAAIRSALGEHP